MSAFISSLHVSLVVLSLGSIVRAEDKPAPRLDPACKCECHERAGITHVTACCKTPPPAIHNEKLGLTVTSAEFGPMKGMRVTKVDPDKPAAFTGIKEDDILLGWINGNIADRDGGGYTPLDEKNLTWFPPPVAMMNTFYRFRVFRPSVGRTSNLTVSFAKGGNLGQDFPDEGLGVVGMHIVLDKDDKVIDGIKFIDKTRLKIFRVWSHSRGNDIGLKKDDEIIEIEMWLPPTLGFIPFAPDAEGVKRMLERARKHPEETVRIKVRNGDVERTLKFKAALLIALKV